MKKITALVITTLTIFSCAGCSAKSDRQEKTKRSEVSFVSEKKGALKTIETFLETEVTEEESTIKLPKSFGGCLVNDDKPDEESEGYVLWTPEIKLEESQQMLFLFKNDKKAVLATPSDKDYQKELVIDSSFKDEANDKNYVDGAFAWEYDGCPQAILDYNAEYVVSSIWLYQQDQNKVFQIWENQNTK